MMKRFLSICMVVILCVGMLPISVFAAEDSGCTCAALCGETVDTTCTVCSAGETCGYVAPTPTVEVTPTAAPTPTVEVTPTAAPTPTVEVTPTAAPTPTVEVTPTVAPTPTVEVTPTPAPTPTVEVTPTPAPVSAEVQAFLDAVAAIQLPNELNDQTGPVLNEQIGAASLAYDALTADEYARADVTAALADLQEAEKYLNAGTATPVVAADATEVTITVTLEDGESKFTNGSTTCSPKITFTKDNIGYTGTSNKIVWIGGYTIQVQHKNKNGLIGLQPLQ